MADAPQKPQICVGFLACIRQEKASNHPKKEIMRGEVFRYGRGPDCLYRVDYPFIDLNHLEIRASRKINNDGTVNVIIKHLAVLPYRTLVIWPGVACSKALDRDTPYLLKSGCQIACGTSDREYVSLVFVAYDKASVLANYQYGTRLGKGGYGEVMAVRNRTTGHPFAMKIVKYGHGDGMAGMNLSAKQEVQILSSCKHDHIVQMIEFFREPGSLMMVLEMARYGDVQSYVLKELPEEKLASRIAAQVFQAVAYLHSRNVAHCDIKPGNMLIFSRAPLVVKLCDFGICVSTQYMFQDARGTRGFQAPEMISRALYWNGRDADSFSLGISIFWMKLPLPPTTHVVAVRCEDRAQWQLLPDNTSQCARDLIRGLILQNPKARLTVQAALKQPWILKYAI